jgi:hypothetical protein
MSITFSCACLVTPGPSSPSILKLVQLSTIFCRFVIKDVSFSDSFYILIYGCQFTLTVSVLCGSFPKFMFIFLFYTFKLNVPFINLTLT